MSRWLLWGLGLGLGCQSEGGLSSQEVTDTWVQSANNQIDILWVIDNSTSMVGEQEILARGFASFATQLDDAGIDFHLGVTTTSFENGDPRAGVLLGEPSVLTATDDYADAFTTRATQAVSTVKPSAKEKGLAAATFALSGVMTLPGGPNAGFLRADAQLLVVFVSDEDDCSDNGILDPHGPEACYTQSDRLPAVAGFLEQLWARKTARAQVQVGAIVGTSSSRCPEVFPGRRYIEAAELTGGLVGDICEADWSGVLEDLGLTAVGIRSAFELSAAAVPGSLRVEIDGDAVEESPSDGWTYDAASGFLTFHGPAVPPRGSTIVARYTEATPR